MSTDRFVNAIAAFDSYHRKDPNTEISGIPKELLYAQRMTARLARFAPDASEAVQLAARCQHIGRWEIPREKYPMGKQGYLQWRNAEKMHHASIAERILADCGYDAAIIEKVKTFLLKKELFTNAETRLLEDIACLVFLEFYAEEFASKHAEEKVVEILRKTMKKMTEQGREATAQLNLSKSLRLLVERASPS